MAESGIVSFHANLRAGRTVCTPRQPGEVERQAGMDAWILNYTVAGRGRIGRGPAGFAAEPHDVLLFPPAVAHDYGPAAPAGRWTHLWVYFLPRPAWPALLDWPEAGGGVRRLRLVDHAWRSEVRGQLERAVDCAAGAERRRDDWAMNALERALLRLDDANPRSAGGIDLPVRRAMGYLGEHHRRALRLAEVAAACGWSASRLAHRFREQVGMPPMRWLEEHRVARARELLLVGSLPVAAVGAEVGIADPVYFARVFRRRSGCSPRAFRRRAVTA